MPKSLCSMSNRRNRSCSSGLAGLFMGIVIVIFAFAFMGTTLSLSSFMNAKRAISIQGASELTYVARAGIEEVMASRYVQRTNFLNHLRYTGNNSNNPPLYGTSGFVYTDPASRIPQNLLGVYRYIVLGGNASVDPTTASIQTNLMTKNQINQHFFIISNGSICVHKTNQSIGIGKISVVSVSGIPRPQCTDNNYDLKQLTLMADTNLSRANNPNNDIVEGYRAFLGSQIVKLPSSVYVPGLGQTASQIDFETAWAGGAQFNHYAVRPVKVAFYTVSEEVPQLTRIFDITGANTVIPSTTKIDRKSLIRIFFQEAVDFRTLFVDLSKNKGIAEGCTRVGIVDDPMNPFNPEDCNIRLRNVSTGAIDRTSSTIFPGIPGSTYVTFMPNLSTANGLTSNRQFTIELDETISDWYGHRLGESGSATGYKITFTTGS